MVRDAFEERRKGYLFVLNKVLAEFLQVVVVDGVTRFRDRRWCYRDKDGMMIIIDDDHVSIHGARLVAKGKLEDVSLR